MRNSKEKIIIGLKKAKSSIERILQMVENSSEKRNDKCFAIIQQNLAVIGLLKSANIAMMENHLDAYIRKNGRTVKQKNDLKKMKKEILKIVQIAQDK